MTDMREEEDDLDAVNAEYLISRAKKMRYDAEIKMQVAEIERIKKEKLEGSVIAVKEVSSIFTDIGAKLKARYKRLISELPPKLAGLDAAQMIPIIRDQLDSVFEDLFLQLYLPEGTDDIDIEQSEDEKPKAKKTAKKKPKSK
jgi:hypothetical protein